MWLARSGWGFCSAGRSFLLCGLWGGFSPVAGGGGRHKPHLLCAEMALGTDSWQGKEGRKGRWRFRILVPAQWASSTGKGVPCVFRRAWSRCQDGWDPCWGVFVPVRWYLAGWWQWQGKPCASSAAPCSPSWQTILLCSTGQGLSSSWECWKTFWEKKSVVLILRESNLGSNILATGRKYGCCHKIMQWISLCTMNGAFAWLYFFLQEAK